MKQNLIDRSYAVLLVSRINTVKELCETLRVSQPTFRKYGVMKDKRVANQLMKNKYA